MLLFTNATVNVLRSTYNAATKTTSAPASHLTNVPVYIREIGNDLRARGLEVTYPARMTFDASHDIVDGDVITGYDPLGVGPGGTDGRSTAPTVIVRHVELKTGVAWSHKVCLLQVGRA